MDTCRIILVDDDSDETELFAHALEAAHKILIQAVCRNYQDLLLVLEKGCPDLILCDLKMPKINGIEVKEGLQTWDKYKDIPFVLISGVSPPPSLTKQAEENNIKAILIKPYSMDGYSQLTDQLLQICCDENMHDAVV
jgi:CheY-like chemotaxis protein